MRLRALLLSLALTAGDYLLWNWSIARGHDIVSLVAGLTLLPLATVSIGGLVLACVRVGRLLLGHAAPSVRAGRASRKKDVYGLAPQDARRQQEASASESGSSRGRLAA